MAVMTDMIIVIMTIAADTNAATHARGQLLRMYDLEGELPGGNIDLDQRALVPVGGPHRSQRIQHGLLNTCIARERDGGHLPELGGLELRGGAPDEGAGAARRLVARDGHGDGHGGVGVLGWLDGLGLLWMVGEGTG